MSEKCISHDRDKNHKCVVCGIEIFDGLADIVDTSDGIRHVKQMWVTGHVE